jgi:hypothetical protein
VKLPDPERLGSIVLILLAVSAVVQILVLVVG